MNVKRIFHIPISANGRQPFWYKTSQMWWVFGRKWIIIRRNWITCEYVRAVLYRRCSMKWTSREREYECNGKCNQLIPLPGTSNVYENEYTQVYVLIKTFQSKYPINWQVYSFCHTNEYKWDYNRKHRKLFIIFFLRHIYILSSSTGGLCQFPVHIFPSLATSNILRVYSVWTSLFCFHFDSFYSYKVYVYNVVLLRLIKTSLFITTKKKNHWIVRWQMVRMRNNQNMVAK